MVFILRRGPEYRKRVADGDVDHLNLIVPRDFTRYRWLFWITLSGQQSSFAIPDILSYFVWLLCATYVSKSYVLHQEVALTVNLVDGFVHSHGNR